MKILLLISILFALMSCQDEVKTTSIEKNSDTVKTQSAKSVDGLPAEEDCDDKFEKAKEEEKKVDENNLFGQNNEGDEGCTIE